MSEPFQRLQDHFRHLNEKHGVDLTVPHGVRIDGKIYPATNKLITIGHKHNKGTEVESRFYIPLENGLKVHTATYLGNGDVYMQMHVPEIAIHNDGSKRYGYGIAAHQHEDSYRASFGKNPNNFDEYYKQRPNPYFEERMSLHDTRGPLSTVHEVLSMWGKEPYQGTYDFVDKEGYQHFKNLRPNVDFDEEPYRPHLELTENELNEHRQNVKFHPSEAPHNVTVYGVDTDRAFYNYNTKTEQLRPWHDVFGDQSNA